jgi:hypothetical protein
MKNYIIFILLFSSFVLNGQIGWDVFHANANCRRGAIYVKTTEFTFWPLDVQWSDGSNKLYLDNLLPGTYCVTVTDGLCCETDTCIEILDTISACYQIKIDDFTNVGNPSGCGKKDGSIYIRELLFRDAVPPYKVWWEDQSGTVIDSTGTRDLRNLSSGVYCLCVLDANNNYGEKCFEIFSAGEPRAITYADAACNDKNNGNAFLIITSDFWQNYTVKFSDGSTLNPIRNAEFEKLNLSAGNYYFDIISSDNSCNLRKDVRIEQLVPSPLQVEFSKKDACPDVISNGISNPSKNGTVSINISGGIPPYGVKWGDGDFRLDGKTSRSGLAAGNYSFTVTDYCGSSIVKSFSISKMEGSISFSPGCNDDGTGSVLVTGGKSPYQFRWSAGMQTKDVAALKTGEYQVTVTDANLCQLKLKAFLQNKSFEPKKISTCSGLNNGEIQYTVTNPNLGPVRILDFASNTVLASGTNKIREEISIKSLRTNTPYHHKIDVDGCVYENNFSLEVSLPNLVYSGFDVGLNSCSYDQYCNDLKILANAARRASTLDFSKSEHGNILNNKCRAPFYCNDPERNNANINTGFYKSYDIQRARAIEYEMFLKKVINQNAALSSLASVKLIQFQNDGLNNCDIVWYCPATLSIVTRVKSFTNWLNRNRGQVLSWDGNCVKINCGFFTKPTICARDINFDNLTTKGNENININPPVLFNCNKTFQCTVRELIMWESAMLQKHPNYFGSDLKSYVDYIKTQNKYELDTIYTYRNTDSAMMEIKILKHDFLKNSGCIDVLFCVDNFKPLLISPPPPVQGCAEIVGNNIRNTIASFSDGCGDEQEIFSGSCGQCPDYTFSRCPLYCRDGNCTTYGKSQNPNFNDFRKLNGEEEVVARIIKTDNIEGKFVGFVDDNQESLPSFRIEKNGEIFLSSMDNREGYYNTHFDESDAILSFDNARILIDAKIQNNRLFLGIQDTFDQRIYQFSSKMINPISLDFREFSSRSFGIVLQDQIKKNGIEIISSGNLGALTPTISRVEVDGSILSSKFSYNENIKLIIHSKGNKIQWGSSNFTLPCVNCLMEVKGNMDSLPSISVIANFDTDEEIVWAGYDSLSIIYILNKVDSSIVRDTYDGDKYGGKISIHKYNLGSSPLIYAFQNYSFVDWNNFDASISRKGNLVLGCTFWEEFKFNNDTEVFEKNGKDILLLKFNRTLEFEGYKYWGTTEKEEVHKVLYKDRHIFMGINMKGKYLVEKTIGNFNFVFDERKDSLATYTITNDTAWVNPTSLLIRSNFNALKESSLSEILVYPTVNDGNFFIKNRGENNFDGMYCLFDLLGNKILEKPLNNLLSLEEQIISINRNLPNGFYFLKLESINGQAATFKIVIQK